MLWPPPHDPANPVCACPDCRAKRAVPGARGGFLRGRYLIPVFFCIACEQARAIVVLLEGEAGPMTGVYHHCLACGWEREITDPLPPTFDGLMKP